MSRTIVLFLSLVLLASCKLTQPPNDTIAPKLTASKPTDGASGIATDAILRLEFSEPMAQGSLALVAAPAVVFSSATWTAPDVATVSAVSGWPPGTLVSVVVTGKDVAGNALASGTVVRFTTAAASQVDETPPATPTNLVATSLDTGFLLDWDANQETDLLGYLVFWGSDPEAPTGFQSVPAPQSDLTVTGLENGVEYHVSVMAEDVNGNRSAPAKGTVTPTDTTPPDLVATVPAAGATGLTDVSLLRFEFSEPMLRTNFELQACEVAEIGTGSPCGASVPLPIGQLTWSESDTVVQVDVSGTFAGGTAYRVTVSASDLAGNHLAPTDLEFALAVEVDDTPPEVTDWFTSINHETHRLEVKLTFSEPMDVASVQGALGSQPKLSCTWTWLDLVTIYCLATSGLRQSTTYLVAVGVGAADLAGNTFEAPWSMQVPVGNLTPRLASVVPQRDAMGEDVQQPIVLTFTEPVDPASLVFSVVRAGNGTSVPGTISFSDDSTSFTFTPTGQYGYSTYVQWTVSALTDLGGTSIAQALSGGFMTRLQAGF